jgi:tRNA(Arg) A34 adenosine deaminase TadA
MKTVLKQAPVLDQEEPLAFFWNQQVAQLATVNLEALTQEQKERHEIYSLLLMALVAHFWNGNKRGMKVPYNWRDNQSWGDFKPLYQGGDHLGEPTGQYLGHNIAALAVDGDGDIIDFEFNHNEIFDSSVEHAESRLVRRLFSLTQLKQGWALDDPDDRGRSYSTLLNKVTIYTSLESCAQCAGIMALARVKEVVYLQKDYGMYCIGNILYNLTNPVKGPAGKIANPHMPAPLPIPASHFDFPYYGMLNQAYEHYHKSVGTKPFDGGKEIRPSVTSFLCTDEAYDIFKKAAGALETQQFVGGYKTNEQVRKKAIEFLTFIKRRGRRGAFHRL